jgi:short-subunit dehydrogenase
MILKALPNWARCFYWSFRRHRPQTFLPVILVTGCGSGIGLALAKILFSRHEYRVVVTARKTSLAVLKRRFQESERFWIRELDVTNIENQAELIAEIEAKWQGVNILINNAGISYRAVVEHMSDSDELLQMATNYLGPASLTRLVMPRMREEGRGKIINVSSVSGMLAMPTMASYSASKYALEGFSEALWYEAKPLGINVSLIQPGFIRSKSFRRVRYTKKSQPSALTEGAPYADYYSGMTPFIERLMNHTFATSQSVAEIIVQVIRTENPPLWVPATLDAVVFYWLRRLVPRRWLMPLLFALLPNARSWAKRYTHRRERNSHSKSA